MPPVRSVFEALDIITGQLVAAKVTSLDKPHPEKCHRNEVAAYRCLPKHPNLVTYLGDFTYNRVGVIVLEKLAVPTLEDFIYDQGPFYVPRALDIFGQIVSVVALMHAHHLSPRDLKTSNIAYDPVTNQVKLFDLGLTLALDPLPNGGYPPVNETTGSPLYMAPEVLLGRPHLSFVHDVWSLGQIFYELIVGYPYFHYCLELSDLRHDIQQPIQYPEDMDLQVMKFLQGMLHRTPRLRLGLKQIHNELQKLRVV